MVILGLGSNVGDREAHLAYAISRLFEVMRDIRVSSLYETSALLPPDAPPQWDMPFLNMALSGETDLSPDALLEFVKSIERDRGRRDVGRWAPRELDIDLLMIDDMVMDSKPLCLPHPGLLERDFALVPLAELVPDWRYPCGDYDGWTIADIVAVKRYTLKPSEHTKMAIYG